MFPRLNERTTSIGKRFDKALVSEKGCVLSEKRCLTVTVSLICLTRGGTASCNTPLFPLDRGDTHSNQDESPGCCQQFLSWPAQLCLLTGGARLAPTPTRQVESDPRSRQERAPHERVHRPS